MRAGRRLGGRLSVAAVACTLALCACGLTGSSTSSSGGRVVVGAVSFAENQILGELYAQVLEHTGFRVVRHFNFAAREDLQPAMEKGEVDVAPEYLASLLEYEDPHAKPSSDPARNAARLRPLLAEHDLQELRYAPADDTNALVVTDVTARRYHLRTVSDLRPVAPRLVFGGPPECAHRFFCLLGLRRVYGLHFKRFKPLDVGGPITIAALEAGAVDVALMFSTSGVIPRRHWHVLIDDKHLQAADNIVPVVRAGVLDAAARDALNRLSATLTTNEMTRLNALVEIDNLDPATVARHYLERQGLI